MSRSLADLRAAAFFSDAFFRTSVAGRSQIVAAEGQRSDLVGDHAVFGAAIMSGLNERCRGGRSREDRCAAKPLTQTG